MSDEEIIEFNKRCAEALGWKRYKNHPTLQWMIPPTLTRTELTSYDSDLHFHDSYDWAMLLVKEAANKRKAEWEWFEMEMLDWLHVSTPRQIAESALTVLEPSQ